jgi:S1-C subfamily serine protease
MWPMKNPRTVLITLMIVGSLAVCAVFAMLVLIPGGPLSNLRLPIKQLNNPVRVFVQAPAIVFAGEEFDMLVGVYNDSSELITVDEIRLPLQLLEISTVKDIFPGSLNQTGFDGQTTGFEINYKIAPGQNQEFQITMMPRASADILGDLLVGIDGQLNPAGFRMVVEAPQALVPTETPVKSTETATPEPPTPTPTPAGIPYKAVVKLTSMTTRSRVYRTGSGTIISPDGIILTNANIVEPGQSSPEISEIIVSMTTSPDEPPVDTYYAEVVRSDLDINLAILRLVSDMGDQPIDRSTLNLPYVPLGDSDQIQIGDPLIILGYPLIGGQTITLVSGDVSGFTSEGRYGNRAFIKTSAMIASGASGGLALDQYGRLIAIPTQLGNGGNDDIVDCRVLVDTNLDGKVNQNDTCIPVGGFINALRPINLGLYLIEAARIAIQATPTVTIQTIPSTTATITSP